MIIVYRKFNWRNFKDCIYQTAKTVTMVMIILVGASSSPASSWDSGGTALVNAIIGLGWANGTYALMQSSTSSWAVSSTGSASS